VTAGQPTGEGKFFAREMTVARVREHPGTEWADVVFLESAQVYRLNRGHPRFDAVLAELRAAAVAKRRVSVTLASPRGNVIEDVA
jgi:hypothetical protein